MAPDATNDGALTPKPVQSVCQQFTTQLQDDTEPRIEDFLDLIEPRFQKELFRSLLAIELQHKSASGEPVAADSYRERFPAYTETIEEIFRSDAPSRSLQSTKDWIHSDTDGGKTPAAASDRDSIPKEIGRFQVARLLGRGGFGTVYLAQDPQLQRTVALKIPRAGILHDQRDRLRFLSEATAAAQLHHPHIVPVHEAGTIDQTCYIASEFIAGTTLREKIAQGWQPTHREIAELLAKLAAALHYAHNKGIIHRDVKPDNIMIDDSGAPHIMDFGLARTERPDRTVTMEGARMGTPSYMSPEQAKGESHLADARSDLWSLGVILYELLTGRKPFRSRSHQLLQEIIEEEPDAPRKISPSIPLDLETIGLKCLTKEPEQRYPSCQHFAEELQRWLNLEPIQARPIGTFERFSRWRRRKPLVAALGGVSLLLALLLIVGGPTMYLREASLRHRAENAEKIANDKTEQVQKTLAEMSMQAALLASQRGKWRQALQHLEAAEEAGYKDDIAIRLKRIRAYRAITEMGKWSGEVKALAARNDLGEYRAELLLSQAEQLRYFQKYDESRKLIEQALQLGLSPAKASYARANLAETVPQALQHLRVSVQMDPYNNDAVGLLVITLFLSGYHKESQQQALLAHRSFPDDPNFPLVLAMSAALNGRREQADDWLKLVEKQYSKKNADSARIYIQAIDAVSDMIDNPNDPKNRIKLIAVLHKAINSLKTIQGSVREIASGDGSDKPQSSTGSFTLSLLPCVRDAYQPLADLFPGIVFSALGGDFSQQIDALERSVQTQPEGAIYWVRGFLLTQSKRFEEAEKDFAAAIEAPAILPALNYLSALFAAESALSQYEADGNREHLARMVKYIYHLKNETRLTPHHKVIAFQSAFVGGDYDLARHFVDDALAKDPANKTWRQYRVMTELAGGSPAKAFEVADQILKENPKDAQALRYKQISAGRLKKLVEKIFNEKNPSDKSENKPNEQAPPEKKKVKEEGTKDKQG